MQTRHQFLTGRAETARRRVAGGAVGRAPRWFHPPLIDGVVGIDGLERFGRQLRTAHQLFQIRKRKEFVQERFCHLNPRETNEIRIE